MNADIENKTGRASANKVGGMRVPAHDHSVPVVRKEHRRLSTDNDAEKNDDERQLERLEQLEVEKQTRLAEGERLARMQEMHPKKEMHNSFKQSQNIYVNQPILHNHNKSGASALE